MILDLDFYMTCGF